MLQTKEGTVHQNTHFVFNDGSFYKIVLFVGYLKRYCRTLQAADDNMTQAHCMLHT